MLGRAAWSQAPLVTDDAAVTPLHAWHLELFQQYADLAAAAAPATAQETTVVGLAWGVLPGLELGFDVPWIAIHGAGTVAGGGDFDLTAKWLLRAAEGDRRTALAVGFAVELPTGNADRGLGSGVADVDLTLIAERRIASTLALRGNLGLQFAGNTLTGAVGSPDRGRVLAGGVSLTADLTPRLQLVCETTGYQGRKSDAGDRELRLQAGLVYARSPHLSVAFTVQRGWLAAPPWVGQLGVVIDP